MIMVFMDTMNFRLLRVKDQYVHKIIRIMKLSHYVEMELPHTYMCLC